MENSRLSNLNTTTDDFPGGPPVVLAEVVPEWDYQPPPPPPPRQRRVWLPLALFVATCLSTFAAGVFDSYESRPAIGPAMLDGLMYSFAVMTILLCHEMGHFVQAWRYDVYASWPYFLPMPLSPIGTFGAVIAMEARKGDRRALFDIGISGPLAGLVPAILFCIVGLMWSEPTFRRVAPGEFMLGSSLLFSALERWFVHMPPGATGLELHPFAMAGWVGLLVTALNLLPIGQLDGGHILYGILRRYAYAVSMVVLTVAVVLSVELRLWHWLPMLALLLFVVGPRHPPTADDDVPLGWFRHVLGWLTLALLPLGFTPVPFLFGQ